MEQADFVFQVIRIRKALRREFEERAAALGITAAQFRVLHRLWEGDGIHTSVLCCEGGSDAGTITGVLDRLEAKGLVRRERDLEDRRAVRVLLTPGGRELEQPLNEILRALDEQAMRGFSVEERGCLMRLLERAGGNLGA